VTLVKTNIKNDVLWGVVIIGLATFLLTPRFFEIGPESWKAWYAATILRETGKFPMFSMGPLYYVYLQLFSFLEYPLSIKLEYFVTHLFCHYSMFLMLRRFIPSKYAILLICAWIPAISGVVSTRYVMGMGFLSLHFSIDGDSVFRKGYLPPYLLMAILCNLGMIFFWIGYVIGNIIERINGKKVPINFTVQGKAAIVAFFLKVSLIVLVVLVVVLPSKRLDNNPFMINMAYSPISLDSHFRVAFFQNSIDQYTKTHIGKRNSCDSNWNFRNQEIYGGAQTVWEAIKYNPKIVLENVIINNLRSVLQIPRIFVLGAVGHDKLPFFRLWFVAESILIFIGAIGYLVGAWKKSNFSELLSIALGITSLISVILLTVFCSRFYMQLLPIGLLFLVNVDKGFELISDSRLANKFCFIKKINNIKFISKINLVQFKKILILGVSVLVFSLSTTSHYFNYDFPAHIKAVVQGKGWLVNENGRISMNQSYTKLFPMLNKEQTIFTSGSYSLWVKSFADVDLDKIDTVYLLPCFEDKEGKIEEYLDSFDLILVNDSMSRVESPNYLCDEQIIYKLHIEPFIEKALKRNWTVQEVDHFGKVYKKMPM